jgi:tRNA G10  N-methylase Trm11
MSRKSELMPYHYTTNQNFEDYASGRVFYALPGQPAFPVRLASEIFQRALAQWRAAGGEGRIHIYDPVCGGAYWLTVLAYLHWEAIASFSASDVDEVVISLAERNLALLTPKGLDKRIAEIEAMLADFGKDSHAAALGSARLLRQQLQIFKESHSIPTQVFQADATSLEQTQRGLGPQPVDLILADVPYGWHTIWTADGERDKPPVTQILEALHPLLKRGAVVAIAADKGQKIHHQNYQRLERFQIGKRRIFILQPL